MGKICVVDGCNEESVGRGLCTKHWTRWKRYGDPHRVKARSEYVHTGQENHAYRHGCEQHPLYHTWANMMRRCFTVGGADYPRYGGRGITVDEAWHDVRNFITDMHPRPPGMTLERKNNSLGYSKSNCVWATRKTQSRNRRSAKLNPEKAEQIRSMRKAGIKRDVIAAQMGVHPSTVKKIIAGKIWLAQ